MNQERRQGMEPQKEKKPGMRLEEFERIFRETARQYKEFDKEPYPFVYRVGDERVRFGPLRGLEMKKERQEK